MQLKVIRIKYQEFELILFNSVTLREKQKRELLLENKQKQQVECLLTFISHNYNVHSNIKRFIN